MTTQAPGNGTTGTTAMTAPAKGPPTLKDLLERAKGRLTAVMPKHLSADRLIKIALACVSRDKTGKLGQCTPESVLLAVMQAAELGLEIGGSLGDAYLVPYQRSWKDDKGNWHKAMEAQFIAGYRGLINLARRSGEIESITAHVVRANDTFTIVYGLEEKLEHKPLLTGDPGELVAVYAVCRFKGGGYQVEVMTRADVVAVRDRPKPWSKGKPVTPDSGPWVTDEPEMWRKTVVRRLCKYLPLSPELRTQLEKEDEIAETADVIDVVAEAAQALPPASATGSLAERIQGAAAPKEKVDETTGELTPGDDSEIAPSDDADKGP